MPKTGLEIFHPLIARWFERTLGSPTQVQQKAWPAIAMGEHVLITAPTGSGKTLTAFLWTLNQLAAGVWQKGAIRVLYVSPLKALNNDIRRNLMLPLQQLMHEFEKEGLPFPELSVAVRSGDTPQTERRGMFRHPPEILITTPESLNLMLSSGARFLFRNLTTVILDEMHGVMNSKRGVYLMTAVERLVPLAGEFQRIGLSATVKPLTLASETLGGFYPGKDNEDGKPRAVVSITTEEKKAYDIRIGFVNTRESEAEGFWTPLKEICKQTMQKNRSTLFFVRGRRMAEKLTLKINEGEPSQLAYAHHGSLSKEIRSDVEKRLKTGMLKAIVATSSLEMGIDIGHLDEVVLVQTPKTVSSAVQRIGRAGHRVNEVSRGTMVPANENDTLECAVLAKALVDQDIETMRPMTAPLDVLAQVLVSMAGTESWDMDSMFHLIRSSASYRLLTRRQFDLVLELLSGRYADSRIRELQPRLHVDRAENRVTARKGALLNLYLSGGVIPDRGYYHIRHQKSAAIIGELDEEYVWEARIGQTFTFGTQKWRIERITHNDVFVLPGNPATNSTPFWRAESLDRDFHFSMRIAEFLEEAENRLVDPDYSSHLEKSCFMDPGSAASLLSYLRSQKAATGALPHRHQILVEHVGTGPGGAPGNQTVLHTFWGGHVNRPFAMILEAGLEERFGSGIETYPSDDFVIFQLPGSLSAEILIDILSGNPEALLRNKLEGSGFFGARFRECAGRALLLPRLHAGQRMPLWMTRLRSQRLFEKIRRTPDFPILLETWRTCMQDFFDLDGLRKMLDEIRSGEIRIAECRTEKPSPMVDAVTWNQINAYMYRGDEPRGKAEYGLKTDWLQEVVFTPGLRPSLSRDLVERFESKRRRIESGYTPASCEDLIDWVRERIWIPEDEWEELVKVIVKESGESPDWLPKAFSRLCWVEAPPVRAVIHPDWWSRLAILYGGGLKWFSGKAGFGRIRDGQSKQAGETESEPDSDSDLVWFLGEWMAAYGPISPMAISGKLSIPETRIRVALEDCGDRIVHGELLIGETDLFCDADNMETLLRMLRASKTRHLDTKPLDRLPLFMAAVQGLPLSSDERTDFGRAMERLEGYAALAELWEGEFLPARFHSYSGTWMDDLMAETGLRWVGCGEKRTAFYFESDLDLIPFGSGSIQTESGIPGMKDFFPDPLAKYDFSTLLRITGYSPSQLSETLWKNVWSGEITNDTYRSLRKGIETHFKIPEGSMERGSVRRRRGTRSGFSRWQGSLPYSGNWIRLTSPSEAEDSVDLEEKNRERARILLDRYGVLFRELLLREEPAFQWSALFRTLRLMELSGEAIGGHFFEGIPGLQFVSPAAIRILQKPPEEGLFWINAADPASCCGLPFDCFRQGLPKRISSTHVTYRGNMPVFFSQSHGKQLDIHVDPDDPDLERILVPLFHLLQRDFQPLKRISIMNINGIDAAKSPFAPVIRSIFETSMDHKTLTLYRKVR